MANIMFLLRDTGNKKGGGDVSIMEIYEILNLYTDHKALIFKVPKLSKGIYINALKTYKNKTLKENIKKFIIDQKIDFIITQFELIPLSIEIFHNEKIYAFVRGFDFLEKNYYPSTLYEWFLINSQLIHRKIFEKIYLESLKRVNVIANSNYTSYKLNFLYGINVFATIEPIIAKPNIDIEFNNQNKKKYVLMITPQKRKGIDLVIKLSKINKNKQFLVLGNTSMKYKRIFKRIENLIYYPWTNNINEFLRLTKVLLVPSIVDETFGRIVVEAKRFGIPSLVSGRGGLKETIGNSGIIVCPEYVEEWHIFLNKLFEDKKFYDNLSSKAYYEFKERIQNFNLFIDMIKKLFE